jgi:hypothetical protein
MTIEHLNQDLYALLLDSGETIEVTGRHPLFSEDRAQWVRAGQLELGERLRTLDGTARVQGLWKRAGIHRVYNLEVDVVHTYHVGIDEVLAHNVGCGDDGAPDAGSDGPSFGASTFTDAAERAIASYLEGFGRKVSKNPMEGVAGAGRQGDAFVDGVLHEFKTLDPGAGPGTVKNVVNNSIRRGGQAREIVIDARGTGLSLEAAQQGAGKALGISRGKVDGVTLIGDDYFFRWSPR